MADAPRAGAVRVWRAPTTTTSNPSSGPQPRDGEMPSLHIVKELLEAHGIEPRPVSGEHELVVVRRSLGPISRMQTSEDFPQIFPVFRTNHGQHLDFWPMSAAQDPELLESPAEVTGVLFRDQELGVGRLPLTMRTATRLGDSGLSNPCSRGSSVNR
jgi:hypothetical protein